MRCKARAHCGVDDVTGPGSGRGLRVTLLFRTGARAFKDEAAVTRVFQKECARVDGCRLATARSDNGTFCDQVSSLQCPSCMVRLAEVSERRAECDFLVSYHGMQVRLMSETDVLIAAHGAQMTNMLFMDRGSSIMEFYPMGWRQRAGGGQFVFRWMVNRAGMRHEGSWWDPNGEPCLRSPVILSCYKNRQIGHDETYFAQWAAEERKTTTSSSGKVAAEERRRHETTCNCN
jgi:hypothetical protein